MGRSGLTPSESALAYADGVVSGEIVACKFVRLACQRFLDDLDRQETDWPYYYDRDAADKAVAWMQNLDHLKGPKSGEKFLLEPFQHFAECNIFGWRHKQSKLRRFTNTYEEQPRKSGKSMRVAARGMRMFCVEGKTDRGMECISGATSEKQAWYIFWYCREWARTMGTFRNRYGITVNAKNLLIMETGAKFEPVIGKPGDGGHYGFAVIDEYHEHPDDSLYDCADTGQGARSQPLLCVITTAGYDMTGPCYERRKDMIHILEGTVVDDSIFGIIYTVDKGDRWDDEASLYKANPNIDVSVSSEYLKKQLAQARRSASKQTAYRTKHLCEWVGARSAFMSMVAWQKQKKTMRIEDFAGEECHIGLDLASRKDLCAASLVFRRGLEYYTFNRFWCSEEEAEKNQDYKKYAAQGLLTLTPGNETDYAYIEQSVIEWAKQFRIKSLAFDPFQATYIIQRLTAIGINCVEYRNTVQYMSDPMKKIEALTLDGKLWNERGNACMDWQVQNVEARLDAKDCIFPRKAKVENRIDGFVALIFAMGRWLTEQEPQEVSIRYI